MINIGNNEISGIYIGDSEISAIYAGDVQIYPMNFGELTGLTLDNLTWVTDVSYEGGTATSANCSFVVTAHYDSGKTRKVTTQSTVTGSLAVPATTLETREMVGVLTLTATYEGFTASDSVDAYQEAYNVDYSTKYLTFKIKSNGNIRWMCTHNTSSYVRTIQYSKDNGETWTSITSTSGSQSTSSGGTFLPVEAGDVVMFRGSNTSYGAGGYYSAFERTEVEFEAYGNITSMIYGSNFTGQTSFNGGTFNFRNFFSYCTGLTSVDNLVLPNNVRDYCYSWALQGCASLITAPALPATTLTSNCYNRMFANSTSLNYVKCLATNPSTSYTGNWLNNVSATGTFVKKAGVTWTTGDISGIPSGWTVIEE